MMAVTAGDITCRELVELVTDYLEGALSEQEHARFGSHMARCAGCEAYVEQIRLTVAAVGAISEETIDPAAREELLRAFRDWNRGGAGGVTSPQEGGRDPA